MFKNENEISGDKLSSIEQPCEPDRDDPLGPPDQLDSAAIPPGVDRRTFLMRSAVVGATVVITGAQMSCQDRTARATAPAPNVPDEPPLSADLNVVKQEKGPVMTTLDEFYKVGPGPSSSHTIGPMRITYDFYQRCTRLPADQLAKATVLKVYLFGSLSATGKGHAIPHGGECEAAEDEVDHARVCAGRHPDAGRLQKESGAAATTGPSTTAGPDGFAFGEPE